MKPMPLVLLALGLCVAAALRGQAVALPNVTLRPAEVINLWPAAAPGETGNIGPERIVPERPRPFDQITDVSVPTLAVFHPPEAKRLGTGVLVIPGGGLDRLAIETEGYEIAEWLNAHGITAFLLKYRVPARSGGPRYKVGLQDAQRAMGLIRSRAAEWKVDADAIGSIGFSAGAEINVMLSVYHAEPRQYPPVDAADTLSTRPDFNIALYGGGFANAADNTMREDVGSRITKTTPPMFIAHAFDDAALSSIILMNALKRANVASELHIFSAGAHGFGVRDTGLPVGRWRELCLDWLAGQCFLDSAQVRAFAREVVRLRLSSIRPAFHVAVPGGDLAQAFAVQRRALKFPIVVIPKQPPLEVAGYKGAFTTTSNAVPGAPLAHGVLFKRGRIDAPNGAEPVVKHDTVYRIETAIGYVIATDIATKLRTPRQALTAVEALVPMVELPGDPDAALYSARPGGPLDNIACNFGSNRFLVGPTVAPKTIADLDALAVALRRDGRVLHETTGADVNGGQAQVLMTLINQIVEQGRILHRGDIITTGALGGAKPAEKGKYSANFGALGRIDFTIE